MVQKLNEMLRTGSISESEILRLLPEMKSRLLNALEQIQPDAGCDGFDNLINLLLTYRGMLVSLRHKRKPQKPPTPMKLTKAFKQQTTQGNQPRKKRKKHKNKLKAGIVRTVHTGQTRKVGSHRSTS